jgi:putative transposase
LHTIRTFLQSTCGWFVTVVAPVSSLLKSRVALQLENVALRHQITVLQRSIKRPRLNACDRLAWVWLSRIWSDWRSSLVIVKPETVIGWHRKEFRMLWAWKIRRGKKGRPAVSAETRNVIRRMSRENPSWGAPRIHGDY